MTTASPCMQGRHGYCNVGSSSGGNRHAKAPLSQRGFWQRRPPPAAVTTATQGRIYRKVGSTSGDYRHACCSALQCLAAKTAATLAQVQLLHPAARDGSLSGGPRCVPWGCMRQGEDGLSGGVQTTTSIARALRDGNGILCRRLGERHAVRQGGHFGCGASAPQGPNPLFVAVGR